MTPTIIRCGCCREGVSSDKTQWDSDINEHVCPDCREENDPDNVMQTPCPKCHGSGREWEGWDCEYCDGMGTDEF